MRPRKNKNKLISLSALLAVLVLMVVTQACSKKSTQPPPPTDQDASGIYIKNGIGKATFTNFNAGAEIDLPDLKGIIQGGRFLFFDKSTNTVFDGQITISLRTITGTAVVYYQGNMIDNAVKVSGTVDTRAPIELNLAANGNFGGATLPGLFSISFYDRPATDLRIDSYIVRWGNGTQRDVMMVNPGMTTSEFNMRGPNNNTYRYVSRSGITITCANDGTVSVSNTNKNIYSLSDGPITGSTCTTLENTTGYTGFASVVDTASTNDTLWYVVANGTYSIFAILTR